MDGKKISFGFSKVSKKPALLPSKQPTEAHSKIELIKCLEGKEIKLVVERQAEAPLVIPLKNNENGLTPAALASLQRRRAVLLDEEEPSTAPSEQQPEATQPLSTTAPVDLEKRAAQELLAELNPTEAAESSQLAVPIVKPDELPLDGAKQSTLDDYEAIPVQQFGMAMLRGMGFVEPPKPKGNAKPEELPFVRPKGMGLGADKALKAKPLLVKPEANEKLEIKKQAYVRILAGKSKDLYGQIIGFDDHAGRVIVKMAIGGGKEALNEFLCQPVAKKEYADYGKCINSNKYEEYKKMANEYGQIVRPKEEAEKSKIRDIKKETEASNVRHIKKESEASNVRHIKKEATYEEEKAAKAQLRASKNEPSDERHSTSKYHDDIERKHSYTKEEDAPKRVAKSSREREQYKHSQPSSSSSSRHNNDLAKSHERDHSRHSRTRQPTDTASDEDAVRRHKHSKSKHKKSKKSKKHRKRDSSASSSDSSTNSSEQERTKNHKKKTKKSRRERSRSRTRR